MLQISPYFTTWSNASRDQLYHAYMKRNYFGSLNGLRFIAIAAVIWHHTAGGRVLSEANITLRGADGVTLFFAISGFLITTLLLREKDKNGFINLKKFYMRRTLRIFPIYYTILLVYVIVVIFLENDPIRSAEFFNNIKYYATYTSNFNVELAAGGTIFFFAWSLATEEQFYLVWPWLEKYTKPMLRILILCGVLLLVFLLRSKIIFVTNGGFLAKVLLQIMPAICFGVLVAHLLNHRKTFRYLCAIFGAKSSSLILFLITFIYLSQDKISFMIVHLLLSLLVMTCIIREDHMLARILNWHPIAWMGTVSYGMYLMHMLTYNAVKLMANKMNVNDDFLNFMVTLTLSAIVASGSYIYYESYFLRLKRKFSV